jgi:hypothetical protein
MHDKRKKIPSKKWHDNILSKNIILSLSPIILLYLPLRRSAASSPHPN